MVSKSNKLIIAALILTACQTSSEFDEFNLNKVDLTRITGESPKEETLFDSALWTAVLGAALLAALSSATSYSAENSMDPAELDSEWIE
tara:strand:- start:53 stop:319 length:267 start_codon:yes stop_codon:yes gene_type:complete